MTRQRTRAEEIAALKTLQRELDKVIEDAPPAFAEALIAEKARIAEALALNCPRSHIRWSFCPHPVFDGGDDIGQARGKPAGVLKRLWHRLASAKRFGEAGLAGRPWQSFERAGDTPQETPCPPLGR